MEDAILLIMLLLGGVAAVRLGLITRLVFGVRRIESLGKAAPWSTCLIAAHEFAQREACFDLARPPKLRFHLEIAAD